MVLLKWLRQHWLPLLVHVGSLLPLAWLIWRASAGLFLVDPVQEITAVTGKTAFILLLLSLACTPISTIMGWTQVMRVRRALGIYAALYAGLHFLTFAGLDYRFDLHLLGPAIVDQPFVVVGFVAGLILLLLTITATRGWQKRLGKNWKRLHRLVYLAGILAVVHFLWLVKDPREPLRYGAALAFLLLLRVPWVRLAVSRARRKITAALRRLASLGHFPPREPHGEPPSAKP